MAMEGIGQGFGAFDTKIDAPGFNTRNRCLRNAAQLRELGLGKALQLTNDAHGFSGRYLDAPFSRNEVTHIQDLR